MSADDRIAQEKEKIVEELKRVPIVLAVCQKVGIGRATFYRWLKEDNAFSKQVDIAKAEGLQTVNDLAESRLISNIQKGDNTAIIYWLKHNHEKYRETVLRLDPVLQKQLQELLVKKEDLFQKILLLVLEGKIATRDLGRLTISLERYQKANTEAKKQREYEALQMLFKK